MGGRAVAAGAERGSHLDPLLAACLIALAVVTKYFAVALVPLLLAYSLLRWQRVKWRIAYLLIPVAACVAYDHVMHVLYGRSMLLTAGSYAISIGGKTDYLQRAIATLCFTGGCLIAVLFYAPLLWSRRILAMAVPAAALLVVLFLLLTDVPSGVSEGGRGGTLLFLSQFVVFFLVGLGLLALTVADLRHAQTPNRRSWPSGPWERSCFVGFSIGPSMGGRSCRWLPRRAF